MNLNAAEAAQGGGGDEGKRWAMREGEEGVCGQDEREQQGVGGCGGRMVNGGGVVKVQGYLQR